MAKELYSHFPRMPSYDLPSDAHCPICVQPYENLTTDTGSFENAVALPCKHIFGSECLLSWLEYRKNCPLCRQEIVLPKTDDRKTTEIYTYMGTLALTLRCNQEWDDYWYGIFWILQLQGDRVIEEKWHQWQQDWFVAAEEWDERCYVHARAALLMSRIATPNIVEHLAQVRTSAAAIQTLRFREYRLFLRFQPDAGEHPELRAPPGFQLTPAQEDFLFQELDRTKAFATVNLPGLSKREQWNELRALGFVWDPDWDVYWNNRCGRWSRYEY